MACNAESESDLTILIGSANIGNAEPTVKSFGEWVPDDGHISGPLSKTKYAVEAAGAAHVSAALRGTAGKQFDIIVLGMQEASFMPPKQEVAKEDCGKTSSAQRRESGVDELTDAIDYVFSDIKKESSKSKHKILRKFTKGNQLRKGVSTSKDYISPTVKHASDGSSDSKEGNKKKYTTTRHDSRTFLELIENRCPSYSMVAASIRGEMRLIVLALKDLTEEISDVYTAGENTGIAKVLANKGGIIVTFNLRGTRLSFMTAHLEAHEGATHYANRNKNIAEIFNGARTDPNYDIYDATIISHHIFVCGDLNYRTCFGGHKKENQRRKSIVFPNKVKDALSSSSHGAEEKTGKTRRIKNKAKTSMDSASQERSSSSTSVPEESILVQPSPEERGSENGTHFAQAKAFVDAQDWKALHDGDELAMALAKKDCLAGFITLPCNFPPTFKVERGEGYQYIEKRTPSYTDRILWKSAHGMSSNVVPFLYEPCPDFITSDHKPIRGGYALKTNKGLPGQATSNSFKDRDRQVHLLVSDIKCSNLPVMDYTAGHLSDPYILFVSYPKSILWEKAWPSTNVIKYDLNPVWDQNIHLALDGEGCRDDKGHVSLNGCMLYMTVMDCDFGSGDDMIGTVSLSLKELCSGLVKEKEHDHSSVVESVVATPILRDGREYGMLNCTIKAAYLTKKEVKAFLDTSTRTVRSKKKIRNNILGIQVGHRDSGRAFQY